VFSDSHCAARATDGRADPSGIGARILDGSGEVLGGFCEKIDLAGESACPTAAKYMAQALD